MCEKTKPQEFITKETIQELFQKNNKELWLLARASVPNSQDTLYAAFYPMGIELYNETKNAISLSDSKVWTDFTKIKLDRYAIKTSLDFSILDESWSLTILEKSKELALVLDSKTDIHIIRIPRPWHRKIFGFRSDKLCNKFIAVVAYLFILTYIITTYLEGYS